MFSVTRLSDRHRTHVVWHTHRKVFRSVTLLWRRPQNILWYFDIVRVKTTLFTAYDTDIDSNEEPRSKHNDKYWNQPLFDKHL